MVLWVKVVLEMKGLQIDNAKKANTRQFFLVLSFKRGATC